MPAMTMPHANKIGEQVLLRIYLLSTDLTGTIPTYERLVQQARQRRLAGATIVRGIFGFGEGEGSTQSSVWHLSYPVPVVAEFVDAGDAIAVFLREEVEPVVQHGTITLERAAVMMYRHRATAEAKPSLQLPGPVEDLSTLPESVRSSNMTSDDQGILLRIFAGESDTHEGQPLYQAVVHKARELGLAGATVLKGAMGFGANSVLHTTKSIELSTDLPIVIELVDVEANVKKLLPHLDAMVHEGMITMEAVRIVAYRHNPADGPKA